MLRTRLFASLLLSALPAMALAATHAAGPVVLVAASGKTADTFMPIKAGDLEITAAAIKAMTPGQPVGGGFITVVNHGSADDRLIGVTIASGVKRVELHEMALNNNIMTMRKLANGMPVPAGQTLEMKPGGLHMMLMGVKAPFKAGETIHAVLEFEKAGRVEIDIPVRDMRPGMQNMKM